MWFMRKFDSIILTYTLESDQNIDVLFEQMIPISICLLAGLKREGGGGRRRKERIPIGPEKVRKKRHTLNTHLSHQRDNFPDLKLNRMALNPSLSV